MKAKIALLCVISILFLYLPQVTPVQAADASWTSGFTVSGFSGASGKVQVQNGIAYMGANTMYSKNMSVAQNYVAKVTMRISKYPTSGHQGFQIMNGTKRTGLYINADKVYPFADGETSASYNVGNDWHNYRFHVNGSEHRIYIDNVLVAVGKTNTFGDPASAKFFAVGDGAVEVSNFEYTEIVEGEIQNTTIMSAKRDTEYTPEFTVDWSDPSTYRDWTITDCENIYVDPRKGTLTFDVQNGLDQLAENQYYQVQRAPKTPKDFDFEFQLQLEQTIGNEFILKVMPDGHNTYMGVHPDRISRSTAREKQSALRVDIGNGWHDWKMAVRGKYLTVSMDGKELDTLEMVSAPGNTAILLFGLITRNGNYKINLGKLHYKPYFGDATLESPMHQAKYTEGENIAFRANSSQNHEYLDYYVNGVNVGKGYSPDYIYVFRNAKAGTYDVAVGYGGETYGATRKMIVETDKSATLNLDKKTLNSTDSLKATVTANGTDISSVEYFLNGNSAGTSQSSPFEVSMGNLEVGTANIFARVTGAYGSVYDTTAENVVVTAKDTSAKLSREYEATYNYSSGNGKLELADGYFKLSMQHSTNGITYETIDGSEEYSLGKGAYKICVVSGVADVYYNGQFAFSFRMPRTDEEKIEYSGVASFGATGRGVKSRILTHEWDNQSSYKKSGMQFPHSYSVEFDKLDASDEKIVIYDGSYKIPLEIKDGIIHTVNSRSEFGKAVPYTLAEKARSGYWRLMVYNGLCQLFIDNKYVDSFAAELCVSPTSVERMVTKPSSSTIFEIKNDDDKFTHEDKFSGNTEMNSLDYWLPDKKTVSASLVNDSTGAYMKLSGTGTYLFNAQTNDTVTKWSAKVVGTNDFYVTARYFQLWHNIKIGYDFTKGCWYTHEYSPNQYHTRDVRTEYSENPLSQSVWHYFELELNGNVLVLKMDGKTVISTDQIDSPYSGYVGFGLSGGNAMIDNFSYTGRCAAIGSVMSTSASSNTNAGNFVELSDGTVAKVNWKGGVQTFDKGKTWTDENRNIPEARFPGEILKLDNGKIMDFSWYHGPDKTKTYASVSEDEGYTYEVRGCISDDVRDTNRVIILGSTATQTSTGRIFLCFDEAYSEQYSSNAIFYSDDEGWTWHESKSVMNGIPTVNLGDFTTEKTGFNTQETMIEELPDGTIRFFGRTGNGFVYYMDSKDGGETFGEYRPTQLVQPLCTYLIEQDPEDPNTYYAITVYNTTTDAHNAVHIPRTRFTLLVSYDGMKNWEYVGTLNETVDFPEETSCNFGFAVYGDTVYIAWNTLWRTYNIVYAVDKNKIKSHKRFETVHETISNEYWGKGTAGEELLPQKAVLPKIDGTAYINGGYEEVECVDGRYDPEVIGKIFGAETEISSHAVRYTLGDASVEFTEGAKEYSINGSTVNCYDVCMEDGLIDLNICAKVFGKTVTEDEDAYWLSYAENYVSYSESAIETGLLKYYDMESADTAIQNGNYVTLETDSEGNTYAKHQFPDDTLVLTMFNKRMVPNGVDLPEEFIAYMDLCNTELGAGFHIEMYGPMGDNGKMSSTAITFKSSKEDKDAWYTYKICGKQMPSGKTMEVEIYRKLRDSHDEYVLLEKGVDYGIAGVVSGHVDSSNSFKIGHFRSATDTGVSGANAAMSYYKDDSATSDVNEALMNGKAVWLIDNLKVTEVNNLKLRFEKENDNLRIDLNVGTCGNINPIIAVYDAEGRMNGYQMQELKVTKEDAVFDCGDVEGKTVKLFLWDFSENLKPIDVNVPDIMEYIK